MTLRELIEKSKHFDANPPQDREEDHEFIMWSLSALPELAGKAEERIAELEAKVKGLRAALADCYCHTDTSPYPVLDCGKCAPCLARKELGR